MFEELKANPEIPRDNNGWKGALQLEIPTALIGGQFSRAIDEVFEEKVIETATKPKKMTEDEKARLRGEIQMGYSNRLNLPGFTETQNHVLPDGAATSGVQGKTVGEILMAARPENSAGSDAQAAGANGQKPAGSDTQVASPAGKSIDVGSAHLFPVATVAE